MTFSEKLQRLRKVNGLSQEHLTEKLNWSRQASSKWERAGGYTDGLLQTKTVPDAEAIQPPRSVFSYTRLCTFFSGI